MAPLKLTQPNCCHFCVTSFGHVITKLWSSLLKIDENLLCYKLHLNSQQASPIVSNHFAL